MWLKRVAEQAAWQGETDPERLTRAFVALQEAGITARENFTCCRTCGQSEIVGEGGPDARGFVHFRTQCTDSAAAGHGLTLLYGGFDGSSETTTAIGDEVVAALEAAGLNAEWDHDPDRAITVTPLDWRRRLVGWGGLPSNHPGATQSSAQGSLVAAVNPFRSAVERTRATAAAVRHSFMHLRCPAAQLTRAGTWAVLSRPPTPRYR